MPAPALHPPRHGPPCGCRGTHSARTALFVLLTRLAWLLLPLLLGGPALAQDQVQQRAYFEDSTGTLSVDQAMAADFQPAGYLLNKGATRSVVWLRLGLAARARPGPALLLLSPTALDDVRLYVQHTASSAVTGAVSGTVSGPISLVERAAQASTPLPLPAGPTVLYLRLQTAGSMMVSAQVLEVAEAQRVERRRLHFQGGLTVFVLAAAAYSCWVFVKTRQLAFLAFGLNILVILLQFSMHFDLLGDWLGDSLGLDTATNKSLTRVSNLANACMGALTMLAFAQHFRFWQPVVTMAKWVALVQIVVFCAYLASGFHPALLFGFIAGMVYTLCFQAAFAVHCLLRHRTLASGGLMAVFVLVYAGMAASLLGGNEPNGLSMFSDIDVFALRALLIPVFMAWLFMTTEADRAAEQARSTEARHQAQMRADLEGRRRQTQSYFLSMLTHELRSPLATIQLASATLSRGQTGDTPDKKRLLHIEKSVDDINYVLERCVEVEQDVDHLLVPQIAPVSIPHLLKDVADSVDARRVALQHGAGDRLAADYQFLRIILANLVSNALKYSPPQSMVELQATGADDPPAATGMRFSVRSRVGDAGVPDAAQVFTRYYRSDGAKRQPGAGLGLWLSQNLASKMGATITMQVADGHIVFSLQVGAAA